MRQFAGFPTAEYIGQPYTRPISLRGISGICVPLLIEWISYGVGTAVPNMVVNVNLNTALVAKKMGVVKSIYIDNMGSAVPIYVICPDTGYVVVAQPNSADWYCVYTNSLQLQIAGLGFLDGSVPTTLVFACNIDQIPSVDLEIASSVALWKASAAITRGNTIYNQNLGTPALGDQTQQFSLVVSGPGVYVPQLFGGPQSGFLYVTDIDAIALASVGAINVNWVIESTGISGVLYTFSFVYLTGSFPGPPSTVLSKSGMNLKLDATQTWRLRVDTQTGATTFSFQMNLNWTANPT